MRILIQRLFCLRSTRPLEILSFSGTRIKQVSPATLIHIQPFMSKCNILSRSRFFFADYIPALIDRDWTIVARSCRADLDS